MRKNPLFNVLAFLFLSVSLCVSTATGQEAKTNPGSQPLAQPETHLVSEPVAHPKAVFPDNVFEFQPVMEGQEVMHDFIVRNQGEADLLIKRVKPG